MKLQLFRFFALMLMTLLAPLAATAQNVYVPNYGDGTVGVLNTATNTITTIPIPLLPSETPCSVSGTTCPEGVVVDGAFAYVTLDQAARVVKIDTGTLTVAGSIPVAERGDPIIFKGPGGASAGRLYVTSWSVGTGCFDDGSAYWDATRRISVIDTALDTEIATIPVGNGTWPLQFSMDGNYAYAVSCEGFISLHKIDLATNSIDDTLVLGYWTTELKRSPTANVMYGTGTDCLRVVDLDTFTEVTSAAICTAETSGGNQFALEFSADGNHAYLLNNSNTNLVTLDTSNPLAPTILSTLTLTTSGFPTELVRGGDTLYVVSPQEWYGLSTSEVIAVTNGGTAAQGCTSSPIGLGGFELDIDEATGTLPWLCPDTPPETDKWNVRGTGHLAARPKVHFEVKARWYKNGGYKGQCNVQDDTPKKGRKVRCLDVTEMFRVGDEIVIKGNALDGKTPTTYEIRVTDYGKPGRTSGDTFAMTTASGFSVGPDTLRNGDIRISKVKQKSHKVHDSFCDHEDDED